MARGSTEGGSITEKSLELLGKDGEPVYFISENEVGLHFWFEYYKRPGVDEPDFEVIFDLTYKVAAKVLEKYGAPKDLSLIDGFKWISAQRLGDQVKADILDGVFPITNKFSWMSW